MERYDKFPITLDEMKRFQDMIKAEYGDSHSEIVKIEINRQYLINGCYVNLLNDEDEPLDEWLDLWLDLGTGEVSIDDIVDEEVQEKYCVVEEFVSDT